MTESPINRRGFFEHATGWLTQDIPGAIIQETEGSMTAPLAGLLALVIALFLTCVLPLAGIGLLAYAGIKRKWKLFRIIVAALFVLIAASLACPVTRQVWIWSWSS